MCFPVLKYVDISSFIIKLKGYNLLTTLGFLSGEYDGSLSKLKSKSRRHLKAQQHTEQSWQGGGGVVGVLCQNSN